ncbi:nucleotidyltransferase [Bacteroidia bacterium]|nr:nucleotidyltransferase [Bacteroidia bacterium]
MATTEQYLRQLYQFKNEHGNAYGIIRIGIFGSVARGEQKEGSDLDIVYESVGMNLWDDIRLWQDLEQFFGASVDVVSLHKRLNPQFRQRIEKDVIYV